MTLSYTPHVDDHGNPIHPPPTEVGDANAPNPESWTIDPRLDRVTDLFEKWAAEEDEHRKAGEYGLATALRDASEDLRAALAPQSGCSHGSQHHEADGYCDQCGAY